MQAREYVTLQVERTRGQLRATAFLRLGSNALSLGGKPLSELVADLAAIGQKPVELIDATAAAGDAIEPFDGDVVSASNAFATNEGMLWNGTDIRFRTDKGVFVSPDQYDYLRQSTLSPSQLFAEADVGTLDVKAVWKSMTRVAREARCDKAKDIFYLTVGELVWECNKGERDAKRIRSPLLMLPIKEENTAAGLFKFKISQPKWKQNSVLRREVLKQMGVNIYEGCAEEITLQELEETLARVKKTAEEYVSGARVDVDAYHVCILDSHDEGVCQAVEKNIVAIAGARLTQVLAGERDYEESEFEQPDTHAVIYPLAADESQKSVIDFVLRGHSVFSPAPAGAGKSQTSVNIAANLAIRGKSVCIMSEKLAANEVFLDYASRIGLDRFCLSVSSDMKTAEIVRQIKSIAKNRRQYVHTLRARETVRQYRAALREYERLSAELYRTDEVLNVSLYELIATAVTAPALPSFDKVRVQKSRYPLLMSELADVGTGCFEVMTDEEFSDYFYHGSCADAELRSMLTAALARLSDVGVDMAALIVDNSLTRETAVGCVRANLARRLALETIGEKNLDEIGNRKVKAIYRQMVDAHLQMQELYVSYLHQELSARIEDNVKDSFIATLDKLKVSKVTPQELFAVYGEDILGICPIVITTPTAAANYIYDTGLDRFHTMIIDEASQMQIISILPYIDRTKQLVVFGDSMQLGITSIFMKKDTVSAADAVQDTSYTDRSVLQAVQGRLPDRSLKYHYRSGTEMLIHVSNKTCYDGLLEIVPDIYTDRAALPAHLGLEVIEVAPPEPTRKGGNENEAREIARRTAELREAHPDRSIGIIAFNERQQELIADMLDETLGGYVDNDRLWVRSLENAQGKEADFVFISIGHFRRNRDGSLHKGISEINRAGGENRLNVLFTRARCKNFIVISFDYRELKKSDNVGVRRLYEYIDYAVNGNINESCVSRASNADHAMVERMSEMLSSLHPDYRTRTRLGSENMAVDIAVKENGNSCYSLGVLMPSFGQTPQETVTKVLVLERSGWHLSPVSPIYFLTAEEAFRAQMKRDMQTPITFTAREHPCFDTNRAPDVCFSAEDLAAIKTAGEDSVTAITEADFLAMDLKARYADVLGKDLWSMDVKTLSVMAKDGDTEANLVLLILLKDRFVTEGKRRSMLANVNRLYSVQNERRASFLLAQMLRIGEVDNHRPLIQKLLDEAHKLGIGR